MRSILTALGLILTASAASAALVEPSVTPVTAPSGKPGYSMKCSGWGRSIEDCYKKAAELCPHGYVIENQQQSTQGIPQQNGSTVIIQRDYMLISCKDAPKPEDPPKPN